MHTINVNTVRGRSYLIFSTRKFPDLRYIRYYVVIDLTQIPGSNAVGYLCDSLHVQILFTMAYIHSECSAFLKQRSN